MKVEQNAILAALPGAERREGAQPGMRVNFIWLVETDFASVLEEEYFIGQTAGQIALKLDRDTYGRDVLRKRGFSKISVDPVVRF